MKIIQYGASHRILDAFLDVTSGDRRVFSQLNLSILNHGVDVDVILLFSPVARGTLMDGFDGG